jgi:hypothetical protein
MAEALRKPAAAAAVPLSQQIAAVEQALATATDIRTKVIGTTPEFAALAAVYDQRIAGLRGALATLREAAGCG